MRPLNLHELQVIVKNGKPTGIILDLKSYQKF